MLNRFSQQWREPWLQRREEVITLALLGKRYHPRVPEHPILDVAMTEARDGCQQALALGEGDRDVQRATTWWSTLNAARGEDAENWQGGYRQAAPKRGSGDAENWVAPGH